MTLPLPFYAPGALNIDGGIPIAMFQNFQNYQNSNLSGPINIQANSVATGTGTAEQTLFTYSLPAGFLLSIGQGLRITASTTYAANGNNKTTKLYFGSEVITSGTLATNNKNGFAEMIVWKTGASTQIVHGNMLIDTTWITPYVATGAETDTAAITIKLTGTDGTSSAGDITANFFCVEVLR